jgi:hypothetical protein
VAVGYYVPDGVAGDPQTLATAFEAEANISAAEVIGGVGEASPTERGMGLIKIKVTGTTAGDITSAATAVGNVAVAPGHGAPA